jgi:ACS family hexuronate transporter-like MFS transporter
MSVEAAGSSSAWKWWICGLLLLASAINYMDRQTLANAAVRITHELELNEEQYGNLELAFGWAFAAGALVFGVLADRVPVRWLYPAVLAAWSTMGILSGLARNYEEMLLARLFLGLFEAGHWPCALKTTQRLLTRSERTLGNSVLQSGASVGAIITPLIMAAMLTPATGSWRPAFVITGAVGYFWVIAWLVLTSREPPASPVETTSEVGAKSAEPAVSFASIVFTRRFFVLVVMVVAINSCWQLLRVWLPKFLQQGRGYSENEALFFNSAYFIATDVGCIAAGAATVMLHRRGMTVHGSRSLVFLVCALLTTLTVTIFWLPAGWLLLGVLLIVAMGALGVFPCYYSFTQELTVTHQGKIAGLLGTLAWGLSSPLHRYFGRYIDSTGSFDLGLALAGCAPILAWLVMLVLWTGKSDEKERH